MGRTEKQPLPPDKDEGITRRKFLKTIVTSTAGYAIGKLGESAYNVATGKPEIQRQEMVGRIVAFSKSIDEKVPAGAGVDHFWLKSGWSEEYPREAYWDALILKNKIDHPEVNISNLKENDVITVLYKIKEGD